MVPIGYSGFEAKVSEGDITYIVPNLSSILNNELELAPLGKIQLVGFPMHHNILLSISLKYGPINGTTPYH